MVQGLVCDAGDEVNVAVDGDDANVNSDIDIDSNIDININADAACRYLPRHNHDQVTFFSVCPRLSTGT